MSMMAHPYPFTWEIDSHEWGSFKYQKLWGGSSTDWTYKYVCDSKMKYTQVKYEIDYL